MRDAFALTTPAAPLWIQGHVPTRNRGLLGLLSLGHLSVDVTTGALPALLPFLQREFHLSYLLLAAVIMTSNLTSSLVQPIFGIASDRAAARYLLPVGVLLAVIGFSALGIAPTYWLLLAAVAFSGIGSAIFHPEGYKSATYVAGNRRATAMSWFTAGGNVGVAIGPLTITAIVAVGGLHATWIALIPGVAVAAALTSALPAVTKAQHAHENVRRAHPDVDESHPAKMSLLIAIVALRSVVFSGMLTFVPLYAVNVLHRSPSSNGPLLFVILAVGALATIVAGPIADRAGKKATMIGALGVIPALLAVYVIVPGAAGNAALVGAGACLMGTMTITVLLGHEFLPTRVALASSLLIGFTSGIGGLAVGALGRLADVSGLTITLWSLVGAAAAAFALALALPEVRTTRDAVPGHLGGSGTLETASSG